MCKWFKAGILLRTERKNEKQNSRVIMFTMPYIVVLTFESVDEIVKCDHSDESF